MLATTYTEVVTQSSEEKSSTQGTSVQNERPSSAPYKLHAGKRASHGADQHAQEGRARMASYHELGLASLRRTMIGFWQ